MKSLRPTRAYASGYRFGYVAAWLVLFAVLFTLAAYLGTRCAP